MAKSATEGRDVEPRDTPNVERRSESGRWAPAVSLAAMFLGVLATYIRPGLFSSRWALVGMDYFQLHIHRIRYAQDALDGGLFALPGWFTREVLGAPFLANIQSFPWIPTRLILLGLDPFRAYGPGVALSAVLTALFTYLFARAARLSPFAAAAAGWTFACSGFFASRVMAGQLTILEAFPALPCVLWLADRACRPGGGGAIERSRVLALALASAFFSMAGHPQFPAYAMLTALAYVLWKDKARVIRAGGAMAAGCGLSLFAWWPMLRFLARSSRLLAAGRPTNDIVFPWWRLGAFILPWKDGWTIPVVREPVTPFTDPNPAYFWDTVCYTGLLPVAAAVVLAFLMVRRRPLDGRIRFVVTAGGLALMLSLPPLGSWMSALPVIIFRSPSRLLYLTEFALALALGAALDRWFTSALRAGARLAPCLALVLLAGHVTDLSLHDRAFVRLLQLPLPSASALEPFLSSMQPGARAAIDHTVAAAFNRAVDDVGFYDSLMPAHTYQALMALLGYEELPSTEIFDAATLSGSALGQLGVMLVLTTREKPELALVRGRDKWKLYVVKDPVPRATFVPAALARRVSDSEILALFRTRGIDLRREILLPETDRVVPPGSSPTAASSGVASAVTYRRASSDEALLSIEAPAAGFVRWTESWDPGWRAWLDDKPAELLRAEGFLMAVRVPAGPHVVRFSYRTPGRRLGLCASIAGLVLLMALVWTAPPARRA